MSFFYRQFQSTKMEMIQKILREFISTLSIPSTIKSDGERITKSHCISFAIPLTKVVLEVPGGPYSKNMVKTSALSVNGSNCKLIEICYNICYIGVINLQVVK